MIKKSILTIILIITMINITTFTSAIQESNIKSNYGSYDRYTHNVLVEFGNSETCTHWPPVSEYLQSIYQSNQNIYIVTLNADEPPAKNRVYSELPNNPIGGLPCVWIDGGLKTIVGDITSTVVERVENEKLSFSIEGGIFQSMGYILSKKDDKTEVVGWAEFDKESDRKVLDKAGSKLLESLKNFMEYLEEGGNPEEYDKKQMLVSP